jgi:hypothetical protein
VLLKDNFIFFYRVGEVRNSLLPIYPNRLMRCNNDDDNDDDDVHDDNDDVVHAVMMRK